MPPPTPEIQIATPPPPSPPSPPSSPETSAPGTSAAAPRRKIPGIVLVLAGAGGVVLGLYLAAVVAGVFMGDAAYDADPSRAKNAAAAPNTAGPASMEDYHALGLRLRREGQIQPAIAAFTTAIQIQLGADEILLDARHQRALAFTDTGEHAKAIADWSDILAMSPLPPALAKRTLAYRAAAYRRLENWQAAWEDERAATRL